MDKLSSSSRNIVSAPCFEHLPHEALQQVLSYLPIKGARNVFKLLSRGYRDSTDYLRVAGLVQARIRRKVLGETQVQASIRFVGLVNDCMDSRLPASTTISLLMGLINLLPDLPVAALSAATRAVLVSSKRLGEKAGCELSEKCMERCIHTYQRRSEMDAQVPRFEPLDDEEARLAARHFCSDLDPAIVTLDQVLNHMENLHAAMAWVGRVTDADERGRLLDPICIHGVATLTVFNQMAGDIQQGGYAQRVQAMRNNLAHAAMQMLPAQTVQGQAALISLALEASSNDRSAYQLAVSAARRLLRQTPDSALRSSWTTIAERLFRAGVVDDLIKRACAWPKPEDRAAMLAQVASAAFKKGALVELDSVCAMINKLVPPRTLPLFELMRKHADTCGAARVEVIVRELIPPLIALPAGLEKFVLIAAASAFIFAPLKHESGMSSEVRLGMLLRLCFESYKKLVKTTFGVSVAGDELMRRQLLALAEALMEQAIAFRFEVEFDARARMRDALIELLSPLAAKITAQ
ncbi:MAG: hypothetical protein JWM30_2723 [Burkholderia sp.]|jgi:hypothetical protein|nr:hypothetical protein [Burkholderia sp.]